MPEKDIEVICYICGRAISYNESYPIIDRSLLYSEEVYADNSKEKTIGFYLCERCYNLKLQNDKIIRERRCKKNDETAL